MYAWCLIDHLCSYLLMLKCWTDVPSDRPTFSEITEEIKQFTSTEESSDVSQPLQTKIEPGGSEEYLGVMGWGPMGGQRIERTWIDRGYRCRGNEGSASVLDQWSVTQSTCRSSACIDTCCRLGHLQTELFAWQLCNFFLYLSLSANI